MEVGIRRLEVLGASELDQLVGLLVACVDAGASIGFLPPLDAAEAEAYWRGVPKPTTLLWVAEREERIEGTVQLHLESRPNGNHRGEIAKLMVHPRARRQGIGRRLMEVAEAAAREHDRTLLVLDTREGDASNELYRALGWTEVGRIPRYARSGTGRLDGTVIYYKER